MTRDIKFEVLNRFTGKVKFAAEIDCAEDEPTSVKLGLAVKWAVKARADLRDAYLRGADLRDADLGRAYLGRADLRDADLGRAYLRGADLRDADLRDADLRGADLRDADLGRADLRGADLRDADLGRAYLRGADLRDADLGRADLRDADLGRAYLRGADLRDADLRDADLGRAYLVDGGQRSDGYRFVGWVKEGVLQIRAGCRSFDINEARAHWQETRGGTALGDETFAILDHIEAVAKIRGLVSEQKEAAE